MTEDDFTPRLGRIRPRGATAGKPYAHQLLAAIQRAGGRQGRKRGAALRHIGRGGAMAAALGNRDRFAAFRQRRVIVKARIVRLAGPGMDRARAHLRYLQRDGVTRTAMRGELYSSDQDRADGKAFLARAEGDRHQFRFIVAAEDAIEYDDLRPLTRRLMAQMQDDLGTHLDWVAVDHFNTGHPHTHILLRGKDDQGRDLVIARSYIATGLRERAAELVRLDLGPQSDHNIAVRLHAELDADRLTNLDRQLLRMERDGGGVSSNSPDPVRQTMLTGRLKRLERLGLATETSPGAWQLAAGLEDTLRRLGERGDIIKTLHRAMTGRGIDRSPADYAIHDPTDPTVRGIVGRVMERGLADELNDRHYLIVDALDGRTHYIEIGRGESAGPTPEGSIVRVTPRPLAPRPVDHTILAVAAGNDGRYTIDLHLRHNPHATEAFAETHLRRLEAIRRATGGIARDPDGTWTITADHLDRVAEYERGRAKAAPVIVEILSPHTLDQQVSADGATWLDRSLVVDPPDPMGASGFGLALRDAQARRRQWLMEQGLAREDQGRTIYQTNLPAVLRQRELVRVAGQLSDQLGLAYVEARSGQSLAGTLRRPITLVSGTYAVIENGRDFTLVPWRPVLEPHIGKTVSGIMRTDGVSWTIGRGRGIS